MVADDENDGGGIDEYEEDFIDHQGQAVNESLEEISRLAQVNQNLHKQLNVLISMIDEEFFFYSIIP